MVVTGNGVASSRRLATTAILAVALGAGVNVAIVFAGGGGLSGGYYAGILGAYMFWGSLVLIGSGVAVTWIGRSAGLPLMLLPALFEVGYLLGGQVSLWLLVLPRA
jgi:hypothetical protein